MELIKKNIHMDRIRSRATSQITIEDDMNVPDNKPDIERIVYDKGRVQIDEIKTSADRAQINGKLEFFCLYITNEEGRKVRVLEGSIPFQEQIYIEGLKNGDSVNVKADIEDLTIGLINSRKISVQSVITLIAYVDEIADEETSVDIIHNENSSDQIPIEYLKKRLSISELAIQKKDVFRIKEEIQLPQELPNIFEILWQNIDVNITEFKAMDEKLSLKGEMKVFILYEGEGEEQPIRWYETTIPISGVVECHSCEEGYIPDISYSISHIDVDVRPDFDGEERVIGIELPLELQIKLYEQEDIDILSDVYGLQNEVNAVTQKGHYKDLLIRNNGKFSIADHIKLNSGNERILQLCHSDGKVQINEIKPVDNGIEVEGNAAIKVLYITNDDQVPFSSVEGNIPFVHTIEVPNMSEDAERHIQMSIDQMNVSMVDSEELDVKADLHVAAVVFKPLDEDIIKEIQIKDLDLDRLKNLPGIVVYVVKKGDTLWKIGKTYNMSVNQIKLLNNLTSDVIKPGDKLILVKSLSA